MMLIKIGRIKVSLMKMISKINQDKVTEFALRLMKDKKFIISNRANLKQSLQDCVNEYVFSLEIDDDVFVLSVDESGRFQLSFY